MSSKLLTPGLAALAFLAGCVTINVYFPAVAAEKAADRIINDVWGPQGRAQEPQGPEQSDDTEQQSALTWRALALQALDWAVSPAHAADPDLDVSSPEIRRIVDSMEARHGELKPYYESGAIGLTRDATVTIRDLSVVSLPERNRVKQLVAEENNDRNALYREIAKANGHPEWESQIRATFAERWVENARAGWHYKNAEGEWVQK